MTQAFRILSVLGVLALAGCGGSMGKISSSSEALMKIPLHLIVNSPYFVNEQKQAIYERVRGGESVPFGEITQAMVRDQYANWIDRHKDSKNPPTIADFYSTIQGLGSGLAAQELGAVKVEVDARLATKQGVPLKYNAQAISVMDTAYDKKVQNYSGTMLLFLALREAWGRDKFQSSGLVAIYESGHVLPGYVLKVNGEWHLIGVETTVSGAGRVLYGPLAQAVKTRMLRIVDADLFCIVELFKFEADNLVDLANEALKATGEKYSIAEPPYLVAQRFRREADYGKIAWSPFGFGSIDIGTGDRERVVLEESPREKLPRANPNITIVHKPDATPDPKKSTPPKTVKPVPFSQEFSNYPYQEIKANNKDGKLFQCWDYSKRKWVDMPHLKVEDEYLISHNPCAYSKPGNYEELPAPLRIRGPMRGRPPGAYPGSYPPSYSPTPYGKTPYGGYPGYGSGYDPDDDSDY
jgi:hypothetical protein